MIRALRQAIARHKLQRIVTRERNSFRVQDYARRRRAALKGRLRETAEAGG